MLVEKLLSILKLYVVFNPPVEMASMVTPIEEQHVLSSFGDICFALGGFGYRHSAARVTQKLKTKPRAQRVTIVVHRSMHHMLGFRGFPVFPSAGLVPCGLERVILEHASRFLFRTTH